MLDSSVEEITFSHCLSDRPDQFIIYDRNNLAAFMNRQLRSSAFIIPEQHHFPWLRLKPA